MFPWQRRAKISKKALCYEQEGFVQIDSSSKVGNGSCINSVDETSELMVMSQFGRIIRIDANPSAPPAAAPRRKAPRAEPQNRVARRRSYPSEEAKTQPEERTLLQ